MSEYVTVILSRDEAIDFCRTVETTRVFLTNETFESMYHKVMKDLAKETKEVEDVR